MNVENQRGSLTGEGAGSDRFPAGMRVLAVDDDPICLKVLDNLLRKCQYKVTVTNEAVKALRLLRENKTKFDIVISDVNMPDMDGFNLLEHVGLELDLPVIMLSAHCDTELVMKGIVHGACDYLLKPVRIEELKNIWQHVVRKRKQERRDQKRSINQENLQSGSAESEYEAVHAGNSSSDQNAREIRKRKDDDKVEGEEDGENDNNENEESSTQKKPRVVWSVELHRKFVAAVNQLGLDKAVPKKILDLMEVEGLTRENVASHLQKYRLYLKRINVTSQQVNMVAPLGSRDSSYMQLVPSPQTSYGDFSSLGGGSTLLSSSPIPSYQPPGMFGQLNSNAGLTIRGIASSPMIQQPVHSQQILTNSYNTLGRPNQPQQHGNRTTHLGDFNQINDPTAFATPAIMSCPPNNALVLHGSNNLQQVPNNAAFGCPSSLGVMNMEPFNHNAVQLPKFPSSSLPLTEASEDPRGNMQCQTGLMGNVFQNMNNREDYNPTLNSSFSSFNSLASGTSGMGPFTPTMDQSSVNNRVEASLNNQMNSSVVPYVPQAAVDRPDGLAQTNFESFDDIMNAVLKRDQNENMLLDGDLGFDAYNLL